MANKQKTYQKIIENNTEIKWSDKNFWELLRFYVVECPSRNGGLNYPVSKRGKLLAAYGWKGGSKFSVLKRTLQQTCCNLKSFEGIQNASVVSKLGEITLPTEYCIYSYSSYEVETLLRKIRNAFAHGNFYQVQFEGQKIYILQNFYHEKMNAEMALYEQTLLKWIDVIKNGPIVKKK